MDIRCRRQMPKRLYIALPDKQSRIEMIKLNLRVPTHPCPVLSS